MQLRKTKLAKQIGVAVVGANLAFFAAADTFTATVNTIDDVQINEITALTFGTNILIAPNGECTMAALVPGNTTMVYAETTGVAEGVNFGDLTAGATPGCVAGDSAALGTSPGIYEITGAIGGTVSILISQVAQVGGDFTFDPSGGCYVNYDGGTTDNGDSCDAYTVGTVLSGQTLADTVLAESDTSGSTVNAVPGSLRFSVGGVITTGPTGLTAETPYNLAFQVDVTY
jgi:hypothetical protein